MSLMRISRWFKSIRSKDVLGTRWDEGLWWGGGGLGGIPVKALGFRSWSVEELLVSGGVH